MSCLIRTQGGCQQCRRLWLLIQYHAKFCTAPKCAEVREAIEERRRGLVEEAAEEEAKVNKNDVIIYVV